MSFMCLYKGPSGECSECGGYDPTGTGLCSHDCGESRARRVALLDAAEQQRRDADDAYGREVDRLHAAGHSYTEIDQMLQGMP